MTRLETMARFKEPDDEPKPLDCCTQCVTELYEGDLVIKFNDEVFCDSDCLLNYLDIRETPLERD